MHKFRNAHTNTLLKINIFKIINRRCQEKNVVIAIFPIQHVANHKNVAKLLPIKDMLKTTSKIRKATVCKKLKYKMKPSELGVNCTYIAPKE